MDLWIVPPIASTPLIAIGTLSAEQYADIQQGRVFVINVRSPVYANSLANHIRAIGQVLRRGNDAAIAAEGMVRRKMVIGKYRDVPVYQEALVWPLNNAPTTTD